MVADPLRALSPRLQETAFWMSQGADYPELQNRMGISLQTAKRYRRDVYDALGVRNSVRAMNLIRRLIA